MSRKLTGIERAVKAVRTQTNLAAAINRTQARISMWVKDGYVPADSARAVSDATGVPVADLLRAPKPPPPVKKRNWRLVKKARERLASAE